MRVISRKLLQEFWEQHPDAEEFLKGWYTVAEAASWGSLKDVRQTYPHADGVPVETETGALTVFNVCGNKYRLIVRINYKFQLINVRAVLTHAQYDHDRWKE